MERIRSLLIHWWLGLSLSTLFFYPVLSALSDRPFYMHWEHDNTLELFTVMVAGGALFGVLLFLTDNYVRSGGGKVLATLAITAVPVLSATTYIVWQLGITAWIKSASEGMSIFSKYGGVILFVAVFGSFSWRYHGLLHRSIITMILVVSPLNFLAAVTVVRAGYFGPMLVHHAPMRSQIDNANTRASVFVLLFDELDPGFLYKDGEVREEYPNIKAFAAKADNYHYAVSPGSETLTAIPGILSGRKVKVNDRQGVRLHEVSDTGAVVPLDIGDASIFALARRHGFTGIIYGWMFPYCEMLKGNIDECEAFSIYNYATVNDAFSVANQVYTNIILSPHSIPLGFLKTPIYNELHHRTASRIFDLALSSLSAEGQVFEFIHFNLPHSPFIYDGTSYNPARDPWLQNEENYVRQVKYVDHLVEQFLAEMQRQARLDTSTVVIMSDHGYRAMAPKGEASRVPLLIKRAGQAMRRDHHDLVKTEEILRSLVVDSAADGLRP